MERDWETELLYWGGSGTGVAAIARGGNVIATWSACCDEPLPAKACERAVSPARWSEHDGAPVKATKVKGENSAPTNLTLISLSSGTTMTLPDPLGSYS